MIDCRCARCGHLFKIGREPHLSDSETRYYSNCPKCGYGCVEEP